MSGQPFVSKGIVTGPIEASQEENRKLKSDIDILIHIKFIRCFARNWSIRHINRDNVSRVDWRRLRSHDQLNVVVFDDILGGDDLNQRSVGLIRHRQISSGGFISSHSLCYDTKKTVPEEVGLSNLHTSSTGDIVVTTVSGIF